MSQGQYKDRVICEVISEEYKAKEETEKAKNNQSEQCSNI